MPDAVYTLFCPNSGQSVVVGCACKKAGHPVEDVGYHHDRCQMNSLTANLSCTGPQGCCGDACQGGTDCEAVTTSCPQGHGDCPVPDACAIHESVKAHHAAMAAAHAEHVELVAAGKAAAAVAHAAAVLDAPPDQCPGGHCHADLPDCKVHHPIVITAGIASAVLRPVTTS